MQYSSITSCLYWVFNQAVPAWLGTILFMQEKTIGVRFFLVALVFTFSPFPAIGLLGIFCITMAFELFSWEGNGKRKQQYAYIAAGLVVFIVYSLFDAQTGRGLGLFFLSGVPLKIFAPQYLLFVFLEFFCISFCCFHILKYQYNILVAAWRGGRFFCGISPGYARGRLACVLAGPAATRPGSAPLRQCPGGGGRFWPTPGLWGGDRPAGRPRGGGQSGPGAASGPQPRPARRRRGPDAFLHSPAGRRGCLGREPASSRWPDTPTGRRGDLFGGRGGEPFFGPGADRHPEYAKALSFGRQRGTRSDRHRRQKTGLARWQKNRTRPRTRWAPDAAGSIPARAVRRRGCSPLSYFRRIFGLARAQRQGQRPAPALGQRLRFVVPRGRWPWGA